MTNYEKYKESIDLILQKDTEEILAFNKNTEEVMFINGSYGR